jgi:hypothetical protein
LGMVPHKPEFRWLGSCCEAGQQDCVSARSGLVASGVEDVAWSNAACPFAQAPAEEGEA